MKGKVIAVAYTIAFFIEQLVSPKLYDMYMEWIGRDASSLLPPFPVFITLLLIWVLQVAIAVMLWEKAFNTPEQ